MNKTIQSTLIALLLMLMQTVCSAQEKVILLASTIGPVDSGIVALLEDQFEKETGIRVRHVGAGTGEALKIAEKGDVELVMVHARSLEEKFVAAGFGTERIPFMYNDFVIVGPSADPAGIRGMTNASAALTQIASKSAPFISRGDNSGTHVAEKELWTKAGVKPVSPWYKVYEKGSEGNAATLEYTDKMGSYTLIDRATYLALKEHIHLEVLTEKDEALINRISLIPVNPKRFPRLSHEEAMTFVKWLTDPDKGQKIVADFGVAKYGSPLFFPDSKEWKEAQTKKEPSH
jgi:tungstate transport system substrate-binding protein